MSGGNWVGIAVGLSAVVFLLFGEPIQRRLAKRRLRRHHCPAPCQESRLCRCGCNGLYGLVDHQDACAVCGAPIVVDDEEPDVLYSSEITTELPAPKGFTSWGWERDREFRRVRHEGEEEQ